MSFTFSHPAAVLPLAYLPKSYTSMTGLVIGSIVPDFEYFLRMKVYSVYSHTWAGMFWFDLPLAIVLTFIFHLFVRDSLIDNLPKPLANRLSTFKSIHWKHQFKNTFLIVITSILFGVTTHIFWDNFTHESGHFVQKIDKLKETITYVGYSFPLYKIIQHLSTIIGGLIVIYALLQLPLNHQYQNQKRPFTFWLLVNVIAVSIVAMRLLIGLDYRLYGSVIVTAISGLILGLVLAPLINGSSIHDSR